MGRHMDGTCELCTCRMSTRHAVVKPDLTGSKAALSIGPEAGPALGRIVGSPVLRILRAHHVHPVQQEQAGPAPAPLAHLRVPAGFRDPVPPHLPHLPAGSASPLLVQVCLSTCVARTYGGRLRGRAAIPIHLPASPSRKGKRGNRREERMNATSIEAGTDLIKADLVTHAVSNGCHEYSKGELVRPKRALKNQQVTSHCISFSNSAQSLASLVLPCLR